MFAVVFNASNILKKERLFPYNHFIYEKSLYPLILFSHYQRQLVSKLLNLLVGILWTSFQAANFLENATVSDILPKAFIFHWRSMVHKEAWLISAKQDLFLYQTHSGMLSLLPVFFFSFLELHSMLDFPFFFFSYGTFSLAINMTSWFWLKWGCLYLCQLWYLQSCFAYWCSEEASLGAFVTTLSS